MSFDARQAFVHFVHAIAELGLISSGDVQMVFSVYVLRDDPDYAIFDVELYNPPVGSAHEYDCAAVFEISGDVFDLQKGAFSFVEVDGNGSCHEGLTVPAALLTVVRTIGVVHAPSSSHVQRIY